MELGRNKAEVELTKKLASTLVQREVMDPMTANGWRQGGGPPPDQAALIIAKQAERDGAKPEEIKKFLEDRGFKEVTPPADGQPAKAEEAPVKEAAPKVPQTSGQPDPSKVTPAPATPATKTDASPSSAAGENLNNLMESLRQPNGLIMGKYKTVEDALRGAGHLANMAKEALQRAEQAEARLTAAPVQPVAAQPVAVPATVPAKPFVPTSRPGLEAAQARLDKVLSKVNESGFDGESAKEFAEANRDVAREQALAVAAEQRERDAHARQSETERFDAVNQYMTQKYPESVNLSNEEFTLFLRLNPLLTEAMSALRAQGREIAAAEFGYNEYVKAQGGAAPAPTPTISRADAEKEEIRLSEREKVRKEARDEALKDAGIVHPSAGGSSAVEAPGITGPTQEEIDADAAAMRREGEAPGSPSAMRWRRKTIGRFLPPELFGS